MDLSKLNPEQQESVKATEGPLLVLAGAGTGKTSVLTSRIIHIVNSFLASPMQILAVTFTNKAAGEMKNRIGQVIGDQVNNLWMGTFHSIGARILRRHPEVVGLKSDFTIINDDDQVRLLKQIIADLNIDSKSYPAKFYLNKISTLKDKLVFPEDIRDNMDTNLPKLADVYSIYQSRLKSMNAADFGDLLAHNITIFNSNPDTLAYYQDKFRYILVDEYQDTNDSQYQWLIKLSSSHQNICCVGDDDQSIYSWRGANIANILRFEKDFKNAKIIRLEQNYRSTSTILKAANDVISNNKERHGKKLWTNSDFGDRIKLICTADDRMESSSIAGIIKNLIDLGKYLPNEVAVLVRAGYQTRPFEEAFISSNITYRVIGGMKFYERMEIRDSISYLRICANLDDDLALLRIINTPKRGIGNTTISNLIKEGNDKNCSLFKAILSAIEGKIIKGKTAEALQELTTKISSFNKLIYHEKLSELAKRIIEEFGYTNIYKLENSVESQGRLENISEFISSLSDFANVTEFLEYVSLVEAKDEKNLENAVNIMTIHGAKGLEFDLVFIPGLEDGIFPSNRSIEERNGLEEERRLMYVAMTRAKKQLILSYALNRYVYGNFQSQTPSRFLKEIPDVNLEKQNLAGGWMGFKSTPGFSSSYLNQELQPKQNSDEYSIGKRIFHQKFGYGTVISSEGSKITINFEKTGTKTIMKTFITAI